MSIHALTHDHRREACGNLLDIDDAGLLGVLTVHRKERLGEYRQPDVGELVAIDALAKKAAGFIGGTSEEWRDAAAAALGVLTRAELAIEAVADIAEEARGQREPERPEPPAPQPPPAVTVGHRHGKRGRR